MPDLRQVAREKALKYRIDPNVFVRQIGAESGFRTRARSGAGAQGIAQIMPDTARAWGVNPHDPVAALDAAAKNMAKYIRKHGSYERALRAYNAGEGAIDRSYKYAETNAYVQKILGGREPKAPVGNARGTQGSAPKLGSTPGRTVTTVTGESEADQRLAILSGYLAQRGKPGALIGLGTGLANIVPQTTTTTRVPGSPATSRATARATGGPAPGAVGALEWARAKIGNPETGENSGGLASYANQRFGMSGQPWCAMFTSLAATKGGAPASARTASVAEVRAKAQRGQGYVRGFIPPARAQAGDLITFGTRHIGMVESVKGNRVTMIAGNDSNRVQRRTVTLGGDDKIVRPAYGRG